MTEVPESPEVLKERQTRAAFDALDAKYGPRYFDMDGNPMSMWDWSMNHELQVNRHVGSTTLCLRGHVYNVSTVHLGLDHSFSPYPHRPVIFETMVFQDGDMGGFEGICERYCTKQEAARGHKKIVRYVRWVVANTPKPKPLIHNGGKP
jgi:hypothetical protein